VQAAHFFTNNESKPQNNKMALNTAAPAIDVINIHEINGDSLDQAAAGQWGGP